MNTCKFVALLAASCSLLLSGCSTAEPTSAVLSNQYPASDALPVYLGWWSVVQFPDPVPAGQVSDPVRVVPGSDYGYALLAPGWDPASGTPPSALIALRSAQKISVARGDTLTFVVADDTTIGNCAAGKALAQEDADFITQRIFPGPFTDQIYDAASCLRYPASGGEGGAGGASAADGGSGG